MLSANTIKKKELTTEELSDIQECFDLFDTKRSGNIDYHEFKIALRALGFNLSKKISGDYFLWKSFANYENLKPVNIKIAILSNGTPDLLKNLVESNDIQNYFDDI